MEEGFSLPAQRSLHHYRIFGVIMASDYSFVNPLPRVSGVPHVSFTCVDTPPYSMQGKEKAVLYASEGKTDDGESLISLEKIDGCYVVHFAKCVDFYLSSDTILAHLLDPAYDYSVEILLLGEIFALWLELRGIPAIHASAVVVDNEAIAFLSTNKGGKSGLAAAMMREGSTILTDDLLPVEYRNNRFIARPGYPAMRMWPDQAGYFLGTYDHLEIVHPWYAKRRILVGSQGFGSFCQEEKPLKIIYIPERGNSDSEVTIEAISGKKAFLELIHNSFSAGIVEGLGLQRERMNFFARMVVQVPMRRLIYPEGFHHLKQVVGSILEDADNTK
jgi:hypothetical protein